MQKNNYNLAAETRKKRSLFLGKMRDNMFKSSMFIAMAIAMVFVAALVVFIFQAGSATFSSGEFPEAN
jgi:hypothetical protein